MRPRKPARRVGPKMRLVAEYVAANPGCPKIGPARYASPYPGQPANRCGLQFGYRAVDRAMAAGLVAGQLAGARYSLRLTEAGRKLINA